MLMTVAHIVLNTPQLGEAAKAAGRLSALHEQLSEDRLEPVAPPVTRGRFDGFTRIEVDGLCFHYPSTGGRRGFAVGPISAGFGRGELVFVIGHNGSGKSTFLKMLTGLYAAEEGSIRVDQQPITPSDLADYRALFGTIFTDHTLFERVYGMAPEDEARAAALLEEMNIAGKTAIRDGRVTERDLSTGQKKRLAMALTLLHDRPIMVFDEWAADQDPGFREYYYHRLLPALRDAGKLVVIVSHDDQHFGLADRTIHFKDGRAIERVVSA
jgi:putative pyoverdin transport system ATP-binding/permease protein